MTTTRQRFQTELDARRTASNGFGFTIVVPLSLLNDLCNDPRSFGFSPDDDLRITKTAEDEATLSVNCEAPAAPH